MEGKREVLYVTNGDQEPIYSEDVFYSVKRGSGLIHWVSANDIREEFDMHFKDFKKANLYSKGYVNGIIYQKKQNERMHKQLI